MKLNKLLALVLVMLLVLGLAACGGDKPESTVDKPESADIPQVLPPDEEAPEPEPEPEPLNQAFLTGLEKGADYPEGKRITAVMVNNITSARPQNGLSEAEVLIEIKVEGGITRFMALYPDYEKMPNVGSVRSARDQFFQLLIPYWGFYIHEGPSGEHPVNWLMRDYDYTEFDLTRNDYGPLLWNESSRNGSSYSWYNTDGELATEAIEAKEASDERTYSSPIFNFVPYNEPARVPDGGEATEVAIIHSASYRTLMAYNGSTGKYDMSMYSGSAGVVPTTDNNNGERLSFDNVIVVFAPMSIYPGSVKDDLVKVDYSVGGAGYYISQGKYELIFWGKGGPQDPLLLYKGDKSGEMIQVNTGRTYLTVVDDSELPAFHDVLTSGTAAEEVGDGQVVENEVDIAD